MVQKNQRLVSLDVFRGLSIAAMILVNNLNEEANSQLSHAVWHGWTIADTIFPFFLWIMGVSLVFSLTKKVEMGVAKKILFRQIFIRFAILFFLGLFLNGFPNFDFSTMRVMGILQRIAICYLFAGILFLQTKLKGQVCWLIGLLTVYWLILKYVPVPGFGSGVLEPNGNIVQYVDLLLLRGHLWSINWDPEGILSTIFATSTVLFGVLTGQLLSTKSATFLKTKTMFISGLGLIIAGSIMNYWLPINKNLWTSSYSVFMSGLALLFFSILYFLTEIKGYKKIFWPFSVYGVNPLTLFLLSQLITKTLSVINLTIPQNLSLLYALGHVFFIYLIARFFYQKKWFLKL